MEDFHPENNQDICKSFFLTICNYTKTNPFLANILRSPRGDEFFEKALTMFHRYVTDATRKTTPSMHSKEEVSYMIACSIGSTLGVLHKWTRENFESSEEIIAGILTQSFLTGILPYLS
jgi:phosphotransferase system  glucose/maltose/N-acetylglucosamine-specific IIC component